MISKEVEEKNKVLQKQLLEYFNFRNDLIKEIGEASYYRLKNNQNIGLVKIKKVEKFLNKRK